MLVIVLEAPFYCFRGTFFELFQLSFLLLESQESFGEGLVFDSFFGGWWNFMRLVCFKVIEVNRIVPLVTIDLLHQQFIRFLQLFPQLLFFLKFKIELFIVCIIFLGTDVILLQFHQTFLQDALEGRAMVVGNTTLSEVVVHQVDVRNLTLIQGFGIYFFFILSHPKGLNDGSFVVMIISIVLQIIFHLILLLLDHGLGLSIPIE